MNEPPRDPELDFSGAVERSESTEVLVPLHADNWALGLASGYLGGSLRPDPAADIQTAAGEGLVGFTGKIPSWAMALGDDGPRVILAIAGSDYVEDRGVMVLQSPLRVTAVSKVLFEDDAALQNFHASYDAFPDVPGKLVEDQAGWSAAVELAPDGERTLPSSMSSWPRRDLDFLGGWAAAVVRFLEAGELDQQLVAFLASPAAGLEEIARNFLLAIEPHSSELDIAIWTATVAALDRRYGKRGFDRQEFLAEIAVSVECHGEEAHAWARGCKKVIDAEIDVPNLDDGGNLGRRAALAVLLAHEPRELPALEEVLGAGLKVIALATTAVFAFTGFSRLDSSNKQPRARMNAVLAIAEGLYLGRPVEVSVDAARVTQELARRQDIVVDGRKALERFLEPQPHLLMLKARAMEAGYLVRVDDPNGTLQIFARGKNSIPVRVEESSCSTHSHPVVDLVVSISPLGARPTTASLKALLAAAWTHCTTVAIREEGGAEHVVAVATVPLATLDRDELAFNVDRLLRVAMELGPRKRVRTKRPGA